MSPRTRPSRASSLPTAPETTSTSRALDEPAVLTRRRGPGRALWVSLRPHQWTKNLLVFAAIALSKHLFEPEPLARAVVAFFVFCGLSGTVYLFNDVADVERDRLHPLKRLRPLAS